MLPLPLVPEPPLGVGTETDTLTVDVPPDALPPVALPPVALPPEAAPPAPPAPPVADEDELVDGAEPEPPYSPANTGKVISEATSMPAILLFMAAPSCCLLFEMDRRRGNSPPVARHAGYVNY